MKFNEMPYQRINLEEKKLRFEELMKDFAAAANGEAQFEVHKRYYEFKDEIDTMVIIASIRHDIDTTDDFYEKERNYYDEIEPELIDMYVRYARLMYESPYRNYLEEKIGTVAFKNIELNIRSFDKKLIPLKQEENALTTEYDKLIASAEIDWDGEILNLSLLRKYLTHKDREVRRKAYSKYSSFFEANGDKLDSIYDKLVKNRTRQAEELGHDNFVGLGYDRVRRNCYDKAMVENFRKQVKEYFVPFAEKLHEKRRSRLGIEKLSCIDESVFFENGNPEPVGTPEEIMASAQDMYGKLSDETKEFFDFMSENELFDVLGRKKKRAGGYMTYLPVYNAPFIFANFNGTSGDINVITHECGHAFQGYLSGKDPIKEHADITMETAEIHSMSMEFFTAPFMDQFFGSRTEDYSSMHLEDAAIFIPYGCMVDEFQHIVYENPQMTPAQRHQAWIQLEKEYRPHLDYTGYPYFEKGGFWQKQPHIYDDPFYYIDYCIAQICAFQYKIRMDENYQEAWDSYLKLCKLSASDFFTNMLKEVGLDSPFEDGCVKRIVEKLDTLCL
ncbi:M3 family oligoendopeptidase [Lacrimispora xylanisolvens]|uniref:M3 family oligoendopeptidase n=1 Tax=Lacrimispora xylanisolvens TaxID=384636 RepID=A0A2S6HXJ8_9FIRM|nr:M3 family oligoendopeptidase [Hungatella xylanolytica]PPK82736.1 M3 family oligoendopeptidase [Hungatella xylanolytica]